MLTNRLTADDLAASYEGALFLDRLPPATEAKMIRHWCVIAKKQTYTEEYLAELRERARTMGAGQKNAEKLPSEDPEAP